MVAGPEAALERVYGRRPRLKSPVRFRSWIGGDRDGNPFVTPEVTAFAGRYAREVARRRFLEALEDLVRDLSLAEARVPVPREVRERGEGVERFMGEPYRRYFAALYRALEREEATTEGLLAALKAAERGLREVGLGRVAEAFLDPLEARLSAFGLELAPLDLREESGRLLGPRPSSSGWAGSTPTSSPFPRRSGSASSPRSSRPPAPSSPWGRPRRGRP